MGERSQRAKPACQLTIQAIASNPLKAKSGDVQLAMGIQGFQGLQYNFREKGREAQHDPIVLGWCYRARPPDPAAGSTLPARAKNQASQALQDLQERALEELARNQERRKQRELQEQHRRKPEAGDLRMAQETAQKLRVEDSGGASEHAPTEADAAEQERRHRRQQDEDDKEAGALSILRLREY